MIQGLIGVVNKNAFVVLYVGYTNFVSNILKSTVKHTTRVVVILVVNSRVSPNVSKPESLASESLEPPAQLRLVFSPHESKTCPTKRTFSKRESLSFESSSFVYRRGRDYRDNIEDVTFTSRVQRPIRGV